MLMNINNNPLTKMFNNSLKNLTIPKNIFYTWNYGSMLMTCMMMQIITGLFMSMYYSYYTFITFNSMNNIYRNINYGWIMQIFHMNNTSIIFICLFMHLSRGLYYFSFKYTNTWMIGMLMMMMLMLTAFLGYILPWGQMSYWGVTVISNLISIIPYLNNIIISWIWGSFSIETTTLTRFFTFHFLTPLIISFSSMIHLMFIHKIGSNNPLGMKNKFNKIMFFPFFWYKDLLSLMIMIFMLMLISFIFPYLFNDPINFEPANPIITPIHIQPEWYFLFTYSILRSIPSKLGGIIFMMMSIIIMFIIPFMYMNKFQTMKFYPFNQFMFWTMIYTMIMLTWMGMQPMKQTLMLSNQLMTMLYFYYFLTNSMLNNLWNKIIN